MSKFKVSVIIPVFNSESFVERAVKSCVELNEVGEVIIVEDGSLDKSMDICFSLNEKYEKVKLFFHRNRVNNGPGITRNLGLSKVSLDFVAFLDSDDLFLPNRFYGECDIFSNMDIDAVHHVIGAEYESEEMKRKHLKRMKQSKLNINSKILPLEFTGVEIKTDPKDLFFHLLKSDRGWIHLNGLTIRKTSLEGIDLFNSNYLGQDSEFITRLSSLRKLVNGFDFKPVAIRNVHSGNRILSQEIIKRKPRQKVNSGYWIKHCLKYNITNRHVYSYLLRKSTYGYLLYQRIFIYIINSIILFCLRHKILSPEKIEFIDS